MLKGIAFLLTSLMALYTVLLPTPVPLQTAFRFAGLPGDTDFITSIQKEATYEDMVATQREATAADVDPNF